MKGEHQVAQRSFLKRHPIIGYSLVLLAAIISVLLIVGLIAKLQITWRQTELGPFYVTANLAPKGQPGEVVRQEPLDEKVVGGHGTRILYRTQRADGSDTFSSAVVYTPDQPASGKPVVAWAHGTLGMGDHCAPSRTATPASTVPGLAAMMAKGWTVTATDYAGFGTPGIQGYLVGEDESHDVLNSVRAARNLTGAGPAVAIWGHSQGGNSALFSASDVAMYAPELQLVGTVASAPAAELVPLMTQQAGTVADWVIGPLVSVSWPAANPTLNVNDILTKVGLKTYHQMANQCILPATLEAFIRLKLGQTYFATNLVDVATWKSMAEDQSAPFLNPGQPLMVVESKADQVVLPNTTALYIQQACKVGSNISMFWLDNVAHQNIPKQSSSQAINWMAARFNGTPVSSSCGQPLPVAPYVIPPTQ